MKVTTPQYKVRAAVAAIQRYSKVGYGEVNGADAFTDEEIYPINECSNPNTTSKEISELNDTSKLESQLIRALNILFSINALPFY
ncbi:hypothetical protein RclHR1_09840002 [Rhizophagus clarus]|uniref:Uncharacterized protein n=1 Tax=Rhizophagus clarus TaxID=94130 RepID=A0A2Z6S5Y2_9GLOM|nr:hypothetical protein RclHR1_09840002 [Rhizophagus clarus]